MVRTSTALLLGVVVELAPKAAGCGAGSWYDVYGGNRCWNWGGGGGFDISCNDKHYGGNCGARMQKSEPFGTGDICMSIKPAPGDGVVTSFYLSNNGGMYDDNGGWWNEIDFEIMGKQGRPEGSQVWTNYFTGSGTEHNGFVPLPFDINAEAHVYCFRVNFTHIDFVVDGQVTRSEDYTAFPDMAASVKGSKFRAYASVWGKSYADGDLGCPEFVNGVGKMDDNPNGFPVRASFQPVDGWVPQAKFAAGRAGTFKPAWMRAAGVSAAAAALAALASVAALAVRRGRTSKQTEQQEPLTLERAEMEEDVDSI